MSSTVQIPIKIFNTGLDTYHQPEVLPEDAFPNLEDVLCYRGVLRKRDGYVNITDFPSYTISGITNAVPAVVTTTSASGYVVGDQIIIYGTEGVTNINGIIFTITAVSSPSFTISNTTAPGAGYIANSGSAKKVSFTGSFSIHSITPGNPTTITTYAAAHNLTSSQQVTIIGVNGAMGAAINNGEYPYTITVTGANTFTITENTTAISYTGGGIVLQPIMGLENRITAAFYEDLIAFNESQAFLFNSYNTGFTNISGSTTWTGNDSQFFWSMNYYGSFWATNNVDPIRYYITGTTWTDFNPQFDSVSTDVVQSALMIFPYKGRFIMLNTTEGATSINYPQRARWSQIGNPYVTTPVPSFVSGPDTDAWRQDITGRGGYIDAPTSEKIVSAGFVRDTLVVMFEHSSWRLRYNGNPLLPFIWERMNSQFGAEGTYSAIEFDEALVAVGRDGIIAADVNAAQRIDTIIPDQVFYMVNGSNNAQRRIQGIRDFQRMLCYWTYCDDLENGGGIPWYPNQTLCYNYLEKSWSVFNQNFTAFGQFREDDEPRWSNTDIAWEAYDNPWSSGNLQTGFPTVVAGNSYGDVYLLESNVTTDDGQPFNFNITTKKFNPFIEKGLQAKAIYAYFLVSGTDAGEFTLSHYIDENDDNPIEIITIPTNTISEEKVWRRVQLSGTGQYHQFVINFSNSEAIDPEIASADYDFFQMIFEFAPAGRLNYGDFTT